jgi:hypothetical protein
LFFTNALLFCFLLFAGLVLGAGGPISEIRNRGKGGERGGKEEGEKEKEKGKKKGKRGNFMADYIKISGDY